jgi:NADPH-dependent 7-cyano-7-deazaguanine reductase QueF
MLHVYLTPNPKKFVIGTNRFFKFLRYTQVPEYSEELVERIAQTLKSRFAWLRVRHVTVEYTPRVARKTIRLELFDMRQQRDYTVLLDGKARPFNRVEQQAVAEKA